MCGALIVTTALVYAQVLHYEFVSWDDPQYITENPNVVAGLTWHGISWALTSGYAGNWHPLTWMSLMLDRQMYGLRAGGYHVSNLLLHVANALLLFGVLYRTTGALGRSSFVAALFAVHPIHVESVAWVTERKDVLSTFFWMLTLWAYVDHVRQPRRGRYAVVLLCFALGLMAKPMLVTLPLVLLLLDVWPLGRLSLGAGPAGRLGSAAAHDPRSAGLRLVVEKIPLFALAAASSLVTFVVQQRGGSVAALSRLPFTSRMANALVSYVGYIGKTLWPARLAAFYPYPRTIAAWSVLGAALLLAAVSVLVIHAARQRPYLAVGWLWYVVTLLPVIGFVQVGTQSMADRYTYVPLVGIFIMAAWGLHDLFSRWPSRAVVEPALAGLVVVACTVTARAQVQYWQNSFSLWTHAAEVTTDNFVAHNNLGNVFSRQGKFDEAIAEYAEALRVRPEYPEGHNDLGNTLKDHGRLAEAVAEYTQALRLKPDYAEAHNNLGIVLVQQGKPGEAIEQYNEALRLNPEFADAYNGQGLALAGQGRVGEAIGRYQEALRINPELNDARDNLGNALAGEGKISEAIAQYSAALRTKPDDAAAHNGLGGVLAGQGKVDEAIAEYTEALRVNPNLADAHANLGNALVGLGRVNEAVAQYSEAVRINPGFAQAHNNLGVILVSQGRLDEAAQQFESALKTRPDYEAARRALAELTAQGAKSGGRR